MIVTSSGRTVGRAVFVLMMGIALAAHGQTQDTVAWPLCCTPNVELGDRLRAAALQDLPFSEVSGAVPRSAGCYSAFATTYLPPAGTQPPEPDFDAISNGDDREQARSNYSNAFLAWTCRYAPDKARDGDTTTAWVEGAEGHGIGAVLVVPYDRPGSGVRIWAGYGKSAALFRANGRPKDIRVHVIAVGNVFANAYDSMYASGADGAYTDLTVVGAHASTLRDHNGYQRLPLPQGEYDQAGTYLIAIELLSVYPGTRYEDTCITEVRGRTEG